ncbi:hypothetical protein [Scytonema sp. PCC 10023]|uniref:hypothetical protein n=1 Tax=Scytonema sp. PCC 10023 TaxID=1680591 RepID=UPI0039C62ADF
MPRNSPSPPTLRVWREYPKGGLDGGIDSTYGSTSGSIISVAKPNFTVARL